jgi:hypothetical protein
MVSGWLICCEKKILLNDWLILADKIKRTCCMLCEKKILLNDWLILADKIKRTCYKRAGQGSTRRGGTKHPTGQQQTTKKNKRSISQATTLVLFSSL